MSAITVLFRYLSLAPASVKRKISEFEGALVKASCTRARAQNGKDISKLFEADFEAVKQTHHST